MRWESILLLQKLRFFETIPDWNFASHLFIVIWFKLYKWSLTVSSFKLKTERLCVSKREIFKVNWISIKLNCIINLGAAFSSDGMLYMLYIRTLDWCRIEEKMCLCLFGSSFGSIRVHVKWLLLSPNQPECDRWCLVTNKLGWNNRRSIMYMLVTAFTSRCCLRSLAVAKEKINF